ncbi:MAG: hypothetical protein CL568_08695 [Alphaproteobacteria bacterium]|jgi:FdrA protein|nr:hypothetical protein [Alphaproteobacteria bacterium]PPR13779.1 MAG: hypothetical protein CFH42_00642 [Alphaproteobacteria bacterium MarineAlpha12_Bin1]|tara:strand:+ start:1520 stop:3079 length:1560 start_codon:yes stop_codon:yes gene_type:complete
MNMITGTRIIADLYRDSVSLMKISSRLDSLPNVIQASCIMATPANINLLLEAGLLSSEIAAEPNEVLIAIEAEDKTSLNEALDLAENELRQRASTNSNREQKSESSEPFSQEMALDINTEANLVLISTPGPYAAAEALKALKLGLNTMIFSDNVTIEDEILLKEYANKKNLMVLGPDCGTSVINGVPLGFANVVKKGNIGIVAASGTGLQQVICLIDEGGGGVSQAIGTGGRDLDSRIGGLSTIQGIKALDKDQETSVVVIISKPPSLKVVDSLIKKVKKMSKPAVFCLFGSNIEDPKVKNIYITETLEDAARTALSLSSNSIEKNIAHKNETRILELLNHVPKVSNNGRYLRALYSGGTFCYEALSLLNGKLEELHSNIAFPKSTLMSNPWESRGHTLLDLGDDLFTRGKAHPMIDFSIRNERLMEEASDPETAVILFDIVLGHCAHTDPSSAIVPIIDQIKSNKENPPPLMIGFICGTEGDPQNLFSQKSNLKKAGVLLANNNAEAVRLAAKVIENL